MTEVDVVVTDASGTPIEGAQVVISTAGGWCGGGDSTCSTDANGKCTIDNNCYFSAGGSYKASAEGYQNASGSVQMGWPGPTSLQISMNAVSSPGPFGCPPGTVLQNGECVQLSGTNLLDGIFSFLGDNWLLLVLLIIIGLVIFMVVASPGTLTGIISSVKG